MYRASNYVNIVIYSAMNIQQQLTYNYLFQNEYWKEKRILEVSYLISGEVVCPQICLAKIPFPLI